MREFIRGVLAVTVTSIMTMTTYAQTNVLKSVAGGGVQGTDFPTIGAPATNIFTSSYGVQTGMTRHVYFPNYEMGINPEDGQRIGGVVRVDPYGKIDWIVSNLPGYLDDITVDHDGSVLAFSRDSDNNRVYRIKLDGSIEPVAGTGPNNFSGDGGPALAAEIGAPEGLAVDADGDIFIASTSLCVVRKVDRATQIISTVAGNPALGCGYNGEGLPANETQLGTLRKIAIDKAGNLLIPDGGNQVLWRVDLNTNNITRIAGTPGVSGYSGDGGQALKATFGGLRSVDTDQWGNIYIGDRANVAIRRIDRTGHITTVAGGPSELLGALTSPTDVSVDLDGQLYISDYGDNLIKKLAFAPAIENMSPTSVAVGSKVVLKGKYFGSFKGASTIKLGTLTIPNANITNWSNSEIHVVIPAGAKTGNFIIATEGGSVSSGRISVK